MLFHPHLAQTIKKSVNTCLICTLSRPKLVWKLIGERRSSFFVPSETIIIDTLFLPRSKYGFRYALIICDAATAYVSCYPAYDLRASTVQKNLLYYLASHVIPKNVICELGSEMRGNLDQFLAQYGINLLSTKPYDKGSSSQAETSIRLLGGVTPNLPK